LAGQEGKIQIVMAGPEILLLEVGIGISRDLKKKFKKCSFEYHAVSDEDAVGQVSRGEVHLAIVTTDIPAQLGLSSKILSEPQFQTVVGAGHPLHSLAKARKIVPIERVLEHPFVSPNHPLLGKVGNKQSLDGWRDDQFPRNVEYLTSSLKLLEELVTNGQALAYLPDYFVKRMNVEVLKVSGCPYSCSQKIRVVAKNPKDRSWLNQWF